MKTVLSNLLQNRVTNVAVLLLVLMTAALGQSFRELNSTKAVPPCGQLCSAAKPCVIAACPVCKLSTTGTGHCAIS